MPFRDSLTAEQLAAIRGRYEISPRRAPCSYQDKVVWADVLALLHEVKRMRAMLLRADQLRDRFPRPNSCLDSVWEDFVRDLAAEPCVLELGSLKQELLQPARRKVKPTA